MYLFGTYCAYPSIPAGVAVTLLHLQLTVDPCETRQACTRVAALSCVHTGGAIHTGMVMGAEVQIWGREECLFTGRLQRERKKKNLSTPDVHRAMNGTLQRKSNLLMLSS